MSVAYDKGNMSVTMIPLCPPFAFESYKITVLQERSTQQCGITWATFYNSVTAQCRKLLGHRIARALFSVY